MDGFEDPVSGAIVTLWVEGTFAGRETLSDRRGLFAFDGIAPGRYDIRVETLGFHPRVVRGFTIRPGTRETVFVEIREGTPPITVVDTVPAGVGGPEARRWLQALELGPPSSSGELTEALTLATTMDRRMGSLGLPSGYTTFSVQGVPFRAVTVAPGIQDFNAALSAGSAGLVRVSPLGAPAFSGMGAGGQIEVFNPTLSSGTAEVSVHGSLAPLWSGRYETADGLSPSSWWVSGRTSVDVVRDSARLLVGADVHHVERPRETLFGDGPGGLGSPGLEDSEVITAFALLDWDFGEGNRMDLGLRVGRRASAIAPFRLTYPRGRSPLDARDILLGGGGLLDVGDDLVLSLRGGFTRSERIASERWSLDPTTPLLVSLPAGTRGGVTPGAAAIGSRDGIFGSASLRLERGSHAIEGGMQVLRSTHALRPFVGSSLWAGSGDPFSDGWQGAAIGTEGATGSVDFAVTNFTIFAQDDWSPSENVRMRVGGRWQKETLPLQDVQVDGEWPLLSGLLPVTPPGTVDGVAGYVGVDWLVGNGAARITADLGAFVDETDPWLLAEFLSSGGNVSTTRLLSDASGFAAWPDFPSSAATSRSAPVLTLIPSSLAAPLSYYATASLSTYRSGWTFGASGAFRRTENLYRRTDLNRSSTPSGTTDSGRDVFGTLVQRGALAMESPGSSRRFQSYDHVWAVLQDGWSEYVGVTVFAERRSTSGFQLSAWYTLSSTTDNLPGLGTGRWDLTTPSTVPGSPDWSEGTSDLDVPSRLGAVLGLPLPVLAGGEIRGRFRLSSGRAFTPGVRDGVDLNADGIAGNDPLWMSVDELAGVGTDWSCVYQTSNGYVERNACRLPWVPYLDLGFSLGLFHVGGGVVRLRADVLNLLHAFDTTVDEALLLVDPGAGLTPDGTSVSPGFRLNPGFGGELFDTRDGRMIRFGLSWGGDR